MESSAREIYYDNGPRRAEQRRATRTQKQLRRERQIKAQRREQRRRARRRRQIAFFMWQCIIIVAIIFLAWQIWLHLGEVNSAVLAEEAGISLSVPENLGVTAENTWGSSELQGGDYVEQVGLSTVDIPVKRTEDEVFLRLLELAEGNEKMQVILENKAAYPSNMLEALANNPEMTDFVMGYLTAEREANGGLTESEMKKEHPLFLQWDPRWGYVFYGDDSNVGLAGCGPTCLSMALFELTRDAALTPDIIAEYAMDNGYYMSGTGTQWALIEEMPLQYGLTVDKLEIEENTMKQELEAGHVLICAMRQGDFTAGGHFIVIYGYDENGFLVNDPNCVARSRQSWSFERIGGQIKQVWAIGE